jgi:alpha-beta hydrolase superfamily lysophospholipase
MEVTRNFIQSQYTKERFKDIPLFLWGESLGGAIAIYTALNGLKDIKINGILLSGPMVTLGEKPNGFVTGMLSFFSKFSNFGVGLEDQTKNTSIPSQQLMYSNHPLCFKDSLPSRTVVQLFKCSDYLIETLSKTQNFDIPMLIQYGEDDTTCTEEGFNLLMERNRNDDKQKIKYKGRHCITHDVGILEVLDDLCNWLSKRS